MAYNPVEALRAAGILGGTMSPAVEEFYASLTQDETETLISLRNRLNAVLPEVVAHEWDRPTAAAEGLDAAMLCLCGAWSGSGTGIEVVE